jgi:hypothetical protein
VRAAVDEDAGPAAGELRLAQTQLPCDAFFAPEAADASRWGGRPDPRQDAHALCAPGMSPVAVFAVAARFRKLVRILRPRTGENLVVSLR